MANLFLDGIYDSYGGLGLASPSAVRLTIPNTSKVSMNLVGLMIGEASFSAGNKWGTVINDVANLSDISSLVGSDSMFTWINASTMCWKGTNPLSMSVEFYLINYKSGLNIEENLKTLVKLSSLAQSGDSKIKAIVHGGYAADIFGSNETSFFTAKEFKDVNTDKLNDLTGKLYEDGYAKGAVTVTFGHTLTVRNLLVSKVNVTKSTIEVASQSGGNIKPLYYRVSVQFTGVRPLLSTDVDSMF